MQFTKKHMEKFEVYLLEEEKAAATLEKYMRDVAAFLQWVGNADVDKTLPPDAHVEIVEDGGKTLYGLGETINVNVEFDNITDELEVKAAMMFRDNESGRYENFGLTQKVLLTPGMVSMPLSADTPGSYSILVEVEDAKGYTILQTPYYFIVQR